MSNEQIAGLLERLNAQFSEVDPVHFVAAENGLPMARIHNHLATAEVYLHGGHVTAYQPAGREGLLWLSPLARFQPCQAIRGGVPVIWPWFGPHPTAPNKPQHGFARVSQWQVQAATVLDDGGTQLQLALRDSPETFALWPHEFALDLSITVGRELSIALTSRNTGKRPFTMGAALHTYFAVGEVEKIAIEGLDGRDYIDQLDNNRRKTQNGVIQIHEEVDRVYLDTEDACIIHDSQLSRRIHIHKAGSRSTVVWNPWADKARAMHDFPEQAYRQMVCIETANAADDVRTLQAGETHTLRQTVGLE